jgi:hypothetical protein
LFQRVVGAVEIGVVEITFQPFAGHPKMSKIVVQQFAQPLGGKKVATAREGPLKSIGAFIPFFSGLRNSALFLLALLSSDRRERIKRQTIASRHLLHRRRAA